LRDPARLTLVVSGVFGLWAGLAHAEWQWAVEFAQMGAGLVQQAPDNPFLVLHAKLWSLITQIVTVALQTGLSERAASYLVSGVAGLLSCQAIAMLTFAMCRRFWVAIGVPPLVLFTGITMQDAIYPVMLLGWSHTFGMFGLSLTLLAVGLIGSGFLRTGAVLAGMSVAVHTSTGAPVIAFVVVAAVLSWRADPVGVRTLSTFLAVGLLISGVSFVLHLALRPPIPQPDPETTRRYLMAWTAFWDEHRRPVDWTRLGALVNVVLPLAILAWLPSLRDNTARMACRILVVATMASLPLAALSALPPDLLPSNLIIGMPARLLNMGLFAATPVTIGLLSSGRAPWSRRAAAAAVLLLVLSSPSVAGFNQRNVLLAIAAATVVVAFVDRRWPVEARVVRPARVALDRPLTAGAVILVGMAVIVRVVLPRSPLLNESRTDLRTATPDPVLAVAASRQGHLATAGDLSLVQLRTRRPVLIDGLTLDSLPYAIESGPTVGGILETVYDMDLFAPPPEARRGGRIPNDPNREAWQRFDLARWQQIRERYDVRDVLTFGDWTLALPLVVSSPGLRLYAIPPR
jgi:hypothetical protein